MTITTTEKEYIKLVYKGTNDANIIARKLQISVERLSKTERKIFSKLKVNCWYNAIRRAFILGILDKSEYSTLDVTDEVDKCAIRIRNIKRLQCNDVDIKLKIYMELITLYNKCEYSYLLRTLDLQKS